MSDGTEKDLLELIDRRVEQKLKNLTLHVGNWSNDPDDETICLALYLGKTLLTECHR